MKACDWCGVRSGRDYDKFKETGLNEYNSAFMVTPAIKESPVNIYCEVVKIEQLGSHDLFIAKVCGITVDEAYMNENGRFALEKCGLLAYSHGEYFSWGKKLGKFGYSVKKKSTGHKKKERKSYGKHKKR